MHFKVLAFNFTLLQVIMTIKFAKSCTFRFLSEAAALIYPVPQFSLFVFCNLLNSVVFVFLSLSQPAIYVLSSK